MKEQRDRPLHRRLHAMLVEAWKAKVFTQESLGKAIGQSQENAGAYLRGKRAGPLDLDEASAALAHVGSSLTAFEAGLPPRKLTRTERVVRELSLDPRALALVEGLLSVPPGKRPRVISTSASVVRLANGKLPPEADEGHDGNTSDTHTRRPPKPRR